jgi:hypothetical protein
VTRSLSKGETFQISCLLNIRNAGSLTFEIRRLEELEELKPKSQQNVTIFLESLQHLDCLEGVYRFLLGEKIRYQTGDLDSYFDLFFLCVLMNRKELAFEMWKQVSFPVRAAICAVRLLHMCPPSAHAHNQ